MSSIAVLDRVEHLASLTVGPVEPLSAEMFRLKLVLTLGSTSNTGLTPKPKIRPRNQGNSTLPVLDNTKEVYNNGVHEKVY